MKLLTASKTQVELNKTYFSVGYNMQCRKCVTKVTPTRFVNDKDHYDIVIESEGVRMYCNASKLYETRKEVKELIARGEG